MHAPRDRHHKVSSLIKVHQNTHNFVKYWSNMKMTNNPVIYEIFKKQYLRSILDISVSVCSLHFILTRWKTFIKLTVKSTSVHVTNFIRHKFVTYPSLQQVLDNLFVVYHCYLGKLSREHICNPDAFSSPISRALNWASLRSYCGLRSFCLYRTSRWRFAML